MSCSYGDKLIRLSSARRLNTCEDSVFGPAVPSRHPWLQGHSAILQEGLIRAKTVSARRLIRAKTVSSWASGRGAPCSASVGIVSGGHYPHRRVLQRVLTA